VDGTAVTLIRQASNTGQLYGSVAVRDIVEALEALGKKIGKNQIALDKPIKAIGIYDVKVALHSEVAVMVKVNVARSPEEADLQSQGVDIMASMFEKDVSGFTEDFDPNAEPGDILGDDAPAPEVPAADAPAAEVAADEPSED
jgi:large subunit ribosomal protein L9